MLTNGVRTVGRSVALDWRDMEKVRAAALLRWEDAVEFASEAFAATGVPPADARKAAEALVDADLHGTVTHGMKNLRNYVSQLLDGRINPRPNMHEVGGPASAKVISPTMAWATSRGTSAWTAQSSWRNNSASALSSCATATTTAHRATGRACRCART